MRKTTRKWRPLLAYVVAAWRKFRRRETDYLNRQRQAILAFYFVAVASAVASNILGLSGAFHPFFTATNSVLLTTILLLGAAYMLGRSGLQFTLSGMALAVQFFISVDNVYSAVNPQVPNNYMVIIINMLLLSGNIIVTLSAYLMRTTQVLVGMAVATYALCICVTNDPVLKDYAYMLLVVLAFFSFLGFLIAKNAERLRQENDMLRNDEAELLHILRLNKQQVKAYIKLAHGHQPTEYTRHLLDLLGETAKHNVITNIMDYMRRDTTDRMRIAATLPQLTPSEIAICQLILQGKKLGDICAALGKSESNVNTQRANIRRKLQLRPSDSLPLELERRMAQPADSW